jgi:glutathione S-transferase
MSEGFVLHGSPHSLPTDIAFAKLSGRDLAEWPRVAAWAGLPGFAAPFDLLAMQDADIAALG